MKRLVRTFAVVVVVTFAVGDGFALAADLSVGGAAPEFTLRGTDGKQHLLGDYVGKQAVVIAWFPRAFGSG